MGISGNLEALRELYEVTIPNPNRECVFSTELLLKLQCTQRNPQLRPGLAERITSSCSAIVWKVGYAQPRSHCHCTRECNEKCARNDSFTCRRFPLLCSSMPDNDS